MHETGIVRDLVGRLLSAMRESGASSASQVHVWMGALTSFSPGHFQEHFEQEVCGTPAEGTKLHIETSQDVLHPQAQQVILKGFDLQVPDEDGEAR